jgi:hypothetical protein
MGLDGYAAERDRALIAHPTRMSVPTTGGELTEAQPTATPSNTAAGGPQRRIRHRRITVMLTALATMLVLLGLATPASAASLPYDNTDPTGCVNKYTYTVQGSGQIRSSTGQVIGIVEMRYSPTCGTKWALALPVWLDLVAAADRRGLTSVLSSGWAPAGVVEPMPPTDRYQRVRRLQLPSPPADWPEPPAEWGGGPWPGPT